MTDRAATRAEDGIWSRPAAHLGFRLARVSSHHSGVAGCRESVQVGAQVSFHFLEESMFLYILKYNKMIRILIRYKGYTIMINKVLRIQSYANQKTTQCFK